MKQLISIIFISSCIYADFALTVTNSTDKEQLVQAADYCSPHPTENWITLAPQSSHTFISEIPFKNVHVVAGKVGRMLQGAPTTPYNLVNTLSIDNSSLMQREYALRKENNNFILELTP